MHSNFAHALPSIGDTVVILRVEGGAPILVVATIKRRLSDLHSMEWGKVSVRHVFEALVDREYRKRSNKKIVVGYTPVATDPEESDQENIGYIIEKD